MEVNNRDKIIKASILGIIVFLALAARLPGVFWGVSLSSEQEFIKYHPDECNIIGIVREFQTGKMCYGYPKGFPFQIAIAGYFSGNSDEALIITGRILSLIYGLLTIVFVYLLAYEIFNNPEIALLSALFLSLAAHHSIESHFATADAGNAFWFLATGYFSYIYLKKKKNAWLVMSIISCGFAIAFKFSGIAVIPLVYVMFRNGKRWFHFFLVFFFIIVLFLAFTGGRTLFFSVAKFGYGFWVDNVKIIESPNRLIVPFVYFIQTIVGLGLPVFIFLLGGGILLILRIYKNRSSRQRDVFIIVAAPAVLQLVLICSLSLPTIRHLLPAVPLFTIIASYGLVKTFENMKKKYGAILKLSTIIIVIAYQLIFLSWVNYHYIFDTRVSASKWILKNIPAGESMTTPRYTKMPMLDDLYAIDDTYESKYIILHSAFYARFTRNEANPFTAYPPLSRVYHGREYNFIKVQSLFKGQLNYELIKAFRIKPVTPEMMALKHVLKNFPPFVGDVLIYRKKS
ncbi:MAG: phospholipid carrier-dependent glycosyltransferase [Planctomycetota bacterium]|nr:MAG: phospholipid carrier-dependent glycosyltransferase [Planctomycetota bacterium]